MKLAYFSPLNPSRSGISDFSEELLVFLKKHFEVGVFTSEAKIENKYIAQNFKIHGIQDYDEDEIRNDYDLAVFHMGNNYELHREIAAMYMKYGGILELHDIALHHYLAEETIVKGNGDKYIEILEYCHGKHGRQAAENYLAGKTPAPWEEQSMRFTVNKHYIEKAQAIIVHSDFAKQMIKGMDYRAKVISIPLHAGKIYSDYAQQKAGSRDKLHIKPDELIFGIFGNITRNKRVGQIFEALHTYKSKNDKFRLFIVGKVHDIDIFQMAKKMDLQQNIFETGYVGLETFDDYMKACDIVFNLRYPIQGESSAVLHRLLGMGKAVMVTDFGPFQEYPDGIVYKVRPDGNEADDILKHIGTLTKQEGRMDILGKEIVDYAEEHFSLQDHAIRYMQFFKGILGETLKEEGIDYILDKIFELQLQNTDYCRHLVERMV